MAEMSDYWLYSMNAPFGRTRVTRGWNRDLVLYDRGWNRDLVLYDHTFSNLSGMERECARTVRSSSKASNPTFQPLTGVGSRDQNMYLYYQPFSKQYGSYPTYDLLLTQF